MEKYLTESQQVLFKNWIKSIPKKYVGAVGGQFGIKIIFTAIGDIVVGFDIDGSEINLTDFDTF
jgi:hypothetical protein